MIKGKITEKNQYQRHRLGRGVISLISIFFLLTIKDWAAAAAAAETAEAVKRVTIMDWDLLIFTGSFIFLCAIRIPLGAWEQLSLRCHREKISGNGDNVDIFALVLCSVLVLSSSQLMSNDWEKKTENNFLPY